MRSAWRRMRIFVSFQPLLLLALTRFVGDVVVAVVVFIFTSDKSKRLADEEDGVDAVDTISSKRSFSCLRGFCSFKFEEEGGAFFLASPPPFDAEKKSKLMSFAEAESVDAPKNSFSTEESGFFCRRRRSHLPYISEQIDLSHVHVVSERREERLVV